MTARSSTDLYLLGSGIRAALQLTVETIQALRASTEVHVLHDDPYVIEQIRQYCPEVYDLVGFYSEDKRRPEIYREISEHLVRRALERSPVSFVVHGHPLFLVSASEYTIELGRRKGLSVQVLPAVSSFDTLLADLGIDFGYGLQLFDCSTLLANGWSMDARVPTLVFQLATLLDDRVVKSDPKPDSLRPLTRYLERFFPENHACMVVHSVVGILGRPEIVSTTIGELHRNERIDLWRRPTLYIPSAGQ